MTDKQQISKDALNLYKPPFRYQYGYIFDSKGEIFSDNGSVTAAREGFAARIRGRGRISYLKNPEALQDAVGEHMAKAVTEYWEKSLAEAR